MWGRVVCCGLALVAILPLAGCKNAYRRELVVVFDAGATPAQHAAALRACTGATPQASPEPIASSRTDAGRRTDVRFRIDHANDREIARLQTCLSQQPGVVGFQDSAANS